MLAQSDSCNLSISGVVRDKHDSELVPFAKVFIRELNYGIISDSLGNYVIPELCKGGYTLTFSLHVGCEPVKIELDLEESQVIPIYIEFQFLEIIEIEHFVLNNQAVSTIKPNDLERLRVSSKKA
jgi:hypothetical protein